MKGIAFKRLFWGKTFPLVSLSGGALLIISSDRLAHAIVVLLALVWSYSLVTLALFGAVRFFPAKGRTVLLAFLTSFVSGLFFLLLWMISPFSALQTFFIIPLIPMLCVSSEIFINFQTRSLKQSLQGSVIEALMYGLLPVIFALIREPIGFSSLSLPGGMQGIILMFSFDNQSLFPVRLIASSSGALLLLGYITGLYRHYKNIHSPEETADG